jgi:hypothetical protein
MTPTKTGQKARGQAQKAAGATKARKAGRKARAKPAPRQAAPWEIQPTESAQQFVGFVAYRDLLAQDRSIDRAYEVASGRTLPKGERAPGYFGRWSVKNAWVDRAKAWDAHVAEQRRVWREQAEKEAVQEMARRHIGVATAMQTLGLNRLKQLTTDTKTISPHAMVRLLVEGPKLERLSRGEPEQIIDLRDGASENSGNGPGDDPAMKALLEDPELIELATRIALRANAAPR